MVLPSNSMGHIRHFPIKQALNDVKSDAKSDAEAREIGCAHELVNSQQMRTLSLLDTHGASRTLHSLIDDCLDQIYFSPSSTRGGRRGSRVFALSDLPTNA